MYFNFIIALLYKEQHKTLKIENKAYTGQV